ncbi:MAG TPA: hypothetical protein PKW90_00365 [Myxococcota bacterium]|nr:hypothetical protein [Myxococcota bacterium]
MWLILACVPNPDRWTPVNADNFWAEEAGDSLPLPPHFEDRRWMEEVSPWGYAGPVLGREEAGTFAVGNGRVFGLVGMDDPPNTITNLIGPTYQVEGGFFGDSAAVLMRGESALVVQGAQVQRPQSSVVVRSRLDYGSAMLETTDVAVPGGTAILRWLTVWSGEEEALRLRVSLARGSEEAASSDGAALLQRRGNRELRISCDGGQSDGTQIDIDVPALPVGESWTTLCTYQLGSGAPVADPLAALDQSYAESRAWLAEGTQLQLADPKVQALVEGALLTMYTQTTPGGLVSPMNRYTKGWLRDSEGPVRLYLDLGRFSDAKAILDATYKASIYERAIANSWSLELPLDRVEEPDDPETFWADADFMPNREPVEAPSYPVLLHMAYARATGEPWDEARLAFLSACLERQERQPDGRMAFSGDETFRYPMAFALGNLPEALGWSSNSSFLAQNAALALGNSEIAAEAASTLERWYFQDGTYAPLSTFAEDQPWPSPHEDTSLQGFWSGTDDLTDLDALLAALEQEDGTLLSKNLGGEPVLGYTGMVPAYRLAAMTARHHATENDAFADLDLTATPSGHFEELHLADHRAMALTHSADGLGADAPARYRPWETGDVVHAMLRYLIGATPDPAQGLLSLSPHLPPGWPSFRAEKLPFGDSSYDLEYSAYEEGIRLVLTGEGPWTVELDLADYAGWDFWVDGQRVEPPLRLSLEGRLELWALPSGSR